MKNIQDNDEARYLLDLKLLSSLKPIKGKVINLENKASNLNIKENINCLNEDKKLNIDNNLLNTNLFFPTKLDYNMTSNNFNNFYCYNNDIHNQMTNMSIKNKKNMFSNNNFFQDPFYFLDNNVNESNYQSLLSFGKMKSKEGFNLLNNNNIKLSQESFLSNKNYLLNNNDITEDDNNKNKISNFDTINFFQNNINYNVINNLNNINLNNNINNNFINNTNIININNNTINNININNNINFNNTLNNNNNINNNKIITEHNNNYNKYELNDFLFKKRNSSEDKISKDNNKYSSKKIIDIKKNLFKIQKKEKDKPILKNNIRLNIIFNCYQNKPKGKLKKQRNKKKLFNFSCSHKNCQYIYKTLKQLQNHHHKMIPECQNDLILLLKLIYNTKLILVKNISNNVYKKKYFSELYENSIKNISFNQYTETISGIHLDEFNL